MLAGLSCCVETTDSVELCVDEIALRFVALSKKQNLGTPTIQLHAIWMNRIKPVSVFCLTLDKLQFGSFLIKRIFKAINIKMNEIIKYKITTFLMVWALNLCFFSNQLFNIVTKVVGWWLNVF